MLYAHKFSWDSIGVGLQHTYCVWTGSLCKLWVKHSNHPYVAAVIWGPIMRLHSRRRRRTFCFQTKWRNRELELIKAFARENKKDYYRRYPCFNALPIFPENDTVHDLMTPPSVYTCKKWQKTKMICSRKKCAPLRLKTLDNYQPAPAKSTGCLKYTWFYERSDFLQPNNFRR